MNSTTKQLMDNLCNKINKGMIDIIYGGLPPYVYSYVDQGRDLKRVGRYDEAVGMYLHAITLCGCIYTEVGRMFAKTLCSMNEYGYALIILFGCASTKWVDQFGFQTPSASDFYQLRDCVISAARGNFEPLFDRTKAVSGNPNYVNEKPSYEIMLDCFELAKLANWI